MLERARKNFPKARRHLQESRAYARKRGPSYTPFQTENQLVACILEIGIYEQISEDFAYKDILEAIEMLGRQLDEARNSSSDQCFQWFDQLDSFLGRWFGTFSDAQRKIVSTQLSRYRSRIKQQIASWERRVKAKRTVDVIDKFLGPS